MAMPAIGTGPFWRSVVYLLDHDEDGALGVVVNHPLDADVDEVLPHWSPLVGAPDCLFEGGPVQADAALALAVVPAGSSLPGWRPAGGQLALVDLDGPVPPREQVLGLRVFAGYAGWDAGQLEGEIAEGAWIVAEAHDEDVFSARPESLWSRVLGRQSGDIRFLATYPADPGLN